LSMLNIQEFGDISNLKKLMFLGIHYATKLLSLAGLETLTNLEGLEITHCSKIHDIAPIGQLKKLERLDLSNNGKLESLRPLISLKALRELYFCASTNVVDGNIELIEELPNISRISFQNRKHYNSNREGFPQWHNPGKAQIYKL
jgi:Leucine-rich repeat (LRR) protein